MRWICCLILSVLPLLAHGDHGEDWQAQQMPTYTKPDHVPWWNQRVWYEVFVRSFYDARSGALANDGIGDFDGLIEKLDYLNDGKPGGNDLGVEALWLMPIMASPSYHGYDVTDYFKVAPEYGSNDDFKRFMQEAHKRGIAVIVDLVLNHVSSQHPWFFKAYAEDAKYHDWFIWRNDDPGSMGPWGQEIWHQKGEKYYYGLFWSEMPDLNFRNPAVGEEMLKAATFWLQDMKVDGFRLDAIRYLYEDGDNLSESPETHKWLKQFFAHYKELRPEAMTVGEVWADTLTVSEYKGQMDLMFQFDYANAILDSVNRSRCGEIRLVTETMLKQFPNNQFATFITNHDQNRSMSVFFNNQDKARLAAAVLLLGPGVPFLYYGEEIGMTGRKPDPDLRTPLPWNDSENGGFTKATPWKELNQNLATTNIATQQASEDSLWQHYRKLIELRRNHPAVLHGGFVDVETSTKRVYAFLRQWQGQNILVLMNFYHKAIDDYGVALEADYAKAKILFGSGELQESSGIQDGKFVGYKPLSSLPARSTVVIQLK